MDVVSRSGCGWNLWLWLVAVVVRRYIAFLILLIPTPLVFVLFCSSISINGLGYSTDAIHCKHYNISA